MEDNKNTQSTGTGDIGTNEDITGAEKKFTQADLDSLAAKVRGEEKSKRDNAINSAVQNAIAEYERKAKLTAEEKAKEAKAEEERKMAERENSITLRERTLEAKELLAEKKIPTDLVEFVIDLDADKTKANIDKLEKAYTKAVEAGVTEKLKGNPPKDPAKKEDTSKNKIVSAF